MPTAVPNYPFPDNIFPSCGGVAPSGDGVVAFRSFPHPREMPPGRGNPENIITIGIKAIFHIPPARATGKNSIQGFITFIRLS